VCVYLSAYPLSGDRKGLTKSFFISFKRVQSVKINTTHKIIVLVQEVGNIGTKCENSMAFITESYVSYAIASIVFLVVCRTGHKQHIVNDNKTLNLEAKIKQHYIKVKPDLADNAYNQIREIIKGEAGAIPIILHCEKTKNTFKLNDSYANNGSDVLLSKLRAVFGEKNVVLNIEKRYHD